MLVRNDKEFSKDYLLQSNNVKYKEGNTPLHLAILKKYNTQQFKNLILKLGENEAAVMARMANNIGQLPIDLCEMPMDKEITKILCDLMMVKNIKSLDEMIDVNDILQRYDSALPQTLKNNLMTACSIVNQVRKIIYDSGTHPQATHYSRYEFNNLNDCINRLRHKMLTDPQFPPLSSLEYDADLIRYYHIGNCTEYSILAISIMRKICDQLLFGEIYYLKKGDHVFVIIDNDVLSSRRNNTRFSPNAVVCDAWAGDVYPVYEIPLRLASFSQYRKLDGNYLNTLVPVNSDLHKLSRCFSTDNIASCTQNSNKMGLGINNSGFFSKKRKNDEFEGAESLTKKIKL